MFPRLLLSFVLPIVALVGICWSLALYFHTDAPHSVSIIGSGMIAFVSAFTWMRELEREHASRETVLRSAIAAAVVVQYLVLVGIVASFGTVEGHETIPVLTQTLISNFTTIVGIVVAFYFGSSAYLEARKPKSDTRVTPPDTGTPNDQA